MNDQVKTIWLKEEISIADDLLSYAPKLLEEFLQYHPDFIDGDFEKGVVNTSPLYDVGTLTSNKAAWKVDVVKYLHKDAGMAFNGEENNEIQLRYPTAVALTKKYGSDCDISMYSILESKSLIKRHTGMENRDGRTLRIHIPLLVPPGDIFFEVEGVEVDWSDLCGFNNQHIHSAFNLTPKRRLVYLIDITTEKLGIPALSGADFERQHSIPLFKRGALPKLLHPHQR